MDTSMDCNGPSCPDCRTALPGFERFLDEVDERYRRYGLPPLT
jgi:hypothetical protein